MPGVAWWLVHREKKGHGCPFPWSVHEFSNELGSGAVSYIIHKIVHRPQQPCSTWRSGLSQGWSAQLFTSPMVCKSAAVSLHVMWSLHPAGDCLWMAIQ